MIAFATGFVKLGKSVRAVTTGIEYLCLTRIATHFAVQESHRDIMRRRGLRYPW